MKKGRNYSCRITWALEPPAHPGSGNHVFLGLSWALYKAVRSHLSIRHILGSAENLSARLVSSQLCTPAPKPLLPQS